MQPLLEAPQRAWRPGTMIQLPLFASEATQQALFHAYGGHFTEPFVFLIAPARSQPTTQSLSSLQQLPLFALAATQLILGNGE